ncbi:hypothetical protein [Winogradskyella sediminis]|uniref:hypothetical protein n=1 Tax=Winogradskyella sediminis TaxID=1382466 RepID=UPI003AA81871
MGFFKKKKIRTDGYYVANFTGINSEYDFYYTLYFNDYGIVALLEFRNEPSKFTPEAYLDFLKQKNKILFSSCTEFKVAGDVSFKYYEPETPDAYENLEVNKNYYSIWKGSIKDNKLYMSCFRSSFNYAEQDYIEVKLFDNLGFDFYKI